MLLSKLIRAYDVYLCTFVSLAMQNYSAERWLESILIDKCDKANSGLDIVINGVKQWREHYSYPYLTNNWFVFYFTKNNAIKYHPS